MKKIVDALKDISVKYNHKQVGMQQDHNLELKLN